MFALVACSILAASLVLARTAEAEEQTPQQTLRAFVATLNAGKPDCSLMLADLREEFFDPLLARQSSFSLRTLTTEGDRLALCRSVIAALRDSAERVRTVIVGIAVTERTDTLARLRVHVRHQYFWPGHDDRRINVWVQIEDGGWKLATYRELLLTTTGAPAPGSLRQWPAYRRPLTKRAAAHREELEHQVTAARDATRVVASRPLACDGRSSHATDPTRDVEWSSGGDPVADQRRPTIDMQAASLHSHAESFCWEVRFRRPPGTSYELNVSVSRRSRKPVPWNVQPVDFRREVWIHVEHGTALAGVEAEHGHGMLNFLPVELSQTDNLIRLKLTRGDLFHRAGPFDGRHAFHWELESFEDNPTGLDDYSNWMDRLAGAPHSP